MYLADYLVAWTSFRNGADKQSFIIITVSPYFATLCFRTPLMNPKTKYLSTHEYLISSWRLTITQCCIILWVLCEWPLHCCDRERCMYRVCSSESSECWWSVVVRSCSDQAGHMDVRRPFSAFSFVRSVRSHGRRPFSALVPQWRPLFLSVLTAHNQSNILVALGSSIQWWLQVMHPILECARTHMRVHSCV